MSEPWWKLWQGRLEFELAELKKHGIPYDFDPDAFDKGQVILHLHHVLDNEPVELIARFPELYPHFRFEVIAPTLDLARHQNPFDKNLCLIGRDTKNWNPQSDNLAKFIVEQLPKALESADGGDSVLEEIQGEPLSEFYPWGGLTVLIDSAWNLDKTINQGEIRIGLSNNLGIVRSALLEIKDSEGNILIQGNSELERLHSDHIRARWIRSDKAIRIGNAQKFYEYLLELHPHLSRQFWKRDHKTKSDYDIIGVVFPEEVKYQTVSDGWIFLLIRRMKSRKRNWKFEFSFVRAGRAGKQDMAERVPSLSFLKDKVIALVGLGSIGAPSALEFAKAGVHELRILDHDYVEAGTTVRWPFGLSSVPFSKTDIIAAQIEHDYPYTKVVKYRERLGAVNPIKPGTKGQGEIMNELLEGADLVYDATAELGVHLFLSDLARRKKIPYLITSATVGAWGGIVARFIPEAGKPCWACFEKARTEGRISLPPEDPAGTVQPVGCASPTFTGVNFDLQELTLMGVRMGISTLSSGNSGDYPVVDWNIAQLSLRDNVRVIPPKWEIINLQQDSNCICANG